MPAVIEFVGIPYSWKTQTIGVLERLLDSQGIATGVIAEFKGSDRFYEERKFSPDVNLVRALNMMSKFVEHACDDRLQIILVDRGVFDSWCWLKWFDQRVTAPQPYFDLMLASLQTISTFTTDYQVVWMERDPIESLRSHGQQQGRIVNHATLGALHDIYDEVTSSPPVPVRVTRVQTQGSSKEKIAARLLREYLHRLK